ncbi:MAG: MBL fold metallo-hydrolase, partial [Janthinobacterium sp.]
MTYSPEHALSVLAVPAFADNYLWLIHDGRHAAVVDPGDATVILDALQAHQLTLSAILLTHHHADHTGGVPELLQHFAVPVFGPRNEAITAITEPLAEGDVAYVPELDLR